jgi:hypothetical protein
MNSALRQMSQPHCQTHCASQHHRAASLTQPRPRPQPFKPLLKFILVKTVIFLTFWQVGLPHASRLPRPPQHPFSCQLVHTMLPMPVCRLHQLTAAPSENCCQRLT